MTKVWLILALVTKRSAMQTIYGHRAVLAFSETKEQALGKHLLEWQNDDYAVESFEIVECTTVKVINE